MYFLIGHRGVGKSTIVKSIDNGFDLDEEISKKYDIADFFEKGKEAKFREVERETLNNLIADESPSVIALGAGFDLGKFDFPENARVIWVQRRSDETGRIFLDRPRLDSSKTPLQEFEDRKQKRDKLYLENSHFSVELEEGGEDINFFIELVQKGKWKAPSHGFYTLKKKIELSFMSGPIELRTDFFEEDEIKDILESRSEFKNLVALRKKPSQNFVKYLTQKSNALIDIPLEYTESDYYNFFSGSDFFVSEHDFISIQEIESFNDQGVHIKWAPEVESFEDLIEYHNMVKGLDVSFLPRSVGDLKGRWNWYRQITYHKNQITFYRYGLNDYIDQPTFYEAGYLSSKSGVSGAVLGGDVSLSHSPAFHRCFFRDHFGGTYLRISLYKDEFVEEHLQFLKTLGISFFSVTSPFKKELGKYSKETDAANTLSVLKEWSVEDTDKRSIIYLRKELKESSRVLIWGSGAVGTAIHNELDGRSELQSIREYKEEAFKDEGFDALVWSAGSECLLRPELSTPPRVIYDIEYKEHSQAKDVALSWGSQYISGEDFFKVQAKFQQKFWLKFKEEQA